MAAIHCGIKINWSRFLFDILKEMVTPSSKQARGICCSTQYYARGSNLTLGESKALPPVKIISVKSVGTYITKNKSVSTAAEKVTEEPVVAKVVTAAAKRRPTPGAETLAKKKRITVGRAAPTVKDLSIVPVQEAVPISMVSAGSPSVQRSQAPKRKLLLQKESYEEETDEREKYKEAIDSEDTIPLSKIRDAVVEEIATFFHSFSIRSLSALKSVSNLAAKEEQMLKWAETDSLQTAFSTSPKSSLCLISELIFNCSCIKLVNHLGVPYNSEDFCCTRSGAPSLFQHRYLQPNQLRLLLNVPV
ncbi:Cyclin-like F-box domain containing protein [Dorcoceras hygrometricum]|uniref:Cyclin-like F-box domain containing protein n=1 Tax=Dorcoceras hygrometricum TaxID=472368 RepID=A0A2Z7AMP9_9LAMI|nr:Cyclin-like F-box domain containing protein [Dorcoceras hygrometricum]